MIEWAGTLAVLAGALGACGDDSPDVGGRCTIEAVLPVPESDEELVRGDITLRNQSTFNAPNGGRFVEVNQVEFSAGFRAFSSTVAPETVQPVSFCVARVGRPEVAESTGLDAGPLELGLDQQRVVLDPDGDLKYATVIQQPWPGAGRPVRMATPMAPSDGFPAFSMETDSVAPLELVEPPLDGPLELRTGPLDLFWEAGNGDYVQVELNPQRSGGPPRFGGQVICVFADTGCGQIPEVAVQVALSEPVNDYRLLVSRVRSVRADLDADTVVDLKVESRVSLPARRASDP
jgi:hypothetical protein